MLPVRAVSDKVCWKFESKGRYTAKSAYRQLQNNRTAVAGTSTQLWQKLWNCMVPPKVLNFGWRLFREILPVLSILQARRMDVLNICPHCHSNEESFLHLFVQCPYARNVWLASDLGWLNPGAATWKEWLTGVFQSASKDRAEAMLMLLWSLWSARNQKVWHHHHTPPMGVVLMASRVLHEWLDVKAKPSVSSTHGESAARTWSRPPAGKLKINSDASVIGRTGMIGGGMVCRDSLGSFIAARTWSGNGCMDSLLAEALAFREALTWAVSKRWHSFIIESDSKLLVNAVNSVSYSDDSQLGLIIFDCKSLISEIGNVECRFIYRSANGVAHLLATHSHSLSGYGDWESVPPPFIVDQL
ncbi:hypothetical protein K2173_025430 [Erythroxylum novogranatense]|uniref:Reverse transcriptase zinc-binding domain-containing protein n=1 Tax=Erythroxylum novogranatense TaxID=1862640 RepID=A0AAV8UHU9_9ROSI|nr:hypothetical protein K2173_025430 [Erythroxylum novogranatense]